MLKTLPHKLRFCGAVANRTYIHIYFFIITLYINTDCFFSCPDITATVNQMLHNYLNLLKTFYFDNIKIENCMKVT